MKLQRAWTFGLLMALLAGALPAAAADDARIENLALCRDSWLDWKNAEPAKLDSFVAYFRTVFEPHGNDAYVVPKSAMTIAGLKVTEVFPQSVGMGLGFSVLVDATFDAARHAVEQQLGKPLGECETGDGMRACGLQIAEQRTVTLMSSDTPGDKRALVGCYYFYEK
jgi:hypothetical protein